MVCFSRHLRSIFVISIFFLGSQIILFAQSPRIFLPEQDTIVEDYFLIEQPTGLKSADLKNKVDLKKFCPQVGNQGGTGSCASFASAYAAVTISHAIANSVEGNDKVNSFVFSPSFVYNQLNQKSCTSATSIVETLEFLKTNGVCFYKDFRFTDDCEKAPSPDAVQIADNFKIEFAATIFKGKIEELEKINLIKSYLNDSIPVISILQVYDSFVELKKGKKFWHYNRDWDNYLGGHHVITIVGYDEKNGCFEIINSWGEDWGAGGYVKIPFKDLADISTIGMVLKVDASQLAQKVDIDELLQEEPIEEVALVETKITNPNSEESTPSTSDDSSNEVLEKDKIKPVAKKGKKKKRKRKIVKRKLRSEFAVNKLFFFNDNLIKRKIKFEYNSDKQIYTSADLKPGDAMQLYLENISKGNHIYILSINDANKVNFHWPKNHEIRNDKLIVQNLLSNSYITIPSEDSALQKNSLGKEKIFILNSTKPIENLRTDSNDVLLEYLNHLESLERSDIVYNDQSIKFSKDYKKDENIVIPLILHLE